MEKDEEEQKCFITIDLYMKNNKYDYFINIFLCNYLYKSTESLNDDDFWETSRLKHCNWGGIFYSYKCL